MYCKLKVKIPLLHGLCSFSSNCKPPAINNEKLYFPLVVIFAKQNYRRKGFVYSGSHQKSLVMFCLSWSMVLRVQKHYVGEFAYISLTGLRYFFGKALRFQNHKRKFVKSPTNLVADESPTRLADFLRKPLAILVVSFTGFLSVYITKRWRLQSQHTSRHITVRNLY